MFLKYKLKDVVTSYEFNALKLFENISYALL